MFNIYFTYGCKTDLSDSITVPLKRWKVWDMNNLGYPVSDKSSSRATPQLILK